MLGIGWVFVNKVCVYDHHHNTAHPCMISSRVQDQHHNTLDTPMHAQFSCYLCSRPTSQHIGHTHACSFLVFRTNITTHWGHQFLLLLVFWTITTLRLPPMLVKLSSEQLFHCMPIICWLVTLLSNIYVSCLGAQSLWSMFQNHHHPSLCWHALWE
jgi:uncharacterized membrane protein YwzB